MENYKFLKDENISGKTIVIRVDLNRMLKTENCLKMQD